jgi:PAS domain-containing protein
VLPELTYSSPFFLSALFSLITACLAFCRRRNLGAWYLVWVCVCSAVWAIFEGVLYLGLNLDASMLATYAQYLGVVPLMPFSVLFTMTVFGYGRWVDKSLIRFFIVASAAILLLVLTDPLHHLVYKDYYLVETGPVTMRAIERGIFWWVIIAYQYMLALVVCVILVLTFLTSTNVLRAQAGVILVAEGMVWTVNAIYVSGMNPLPYMDISPLTFIFVSMAMAWGFFRYSLLDMLPIVKSEIYLTLNDPILVLDDKECLIDLNTAAASLLNIPLSKSIGRNIVQLFNQQHKGLSLPKENQIQQMGLLVDGRERIFHLRTSVLKNKRGVGIGRILIFQDVTESIHAERAVYENERLQGVLEMAGAVCHDLSQPVMAIMGYAELISTNLPGDDALYQKTLEMAHQAEELRKITQQLVRITRYETKNHQGSRIIDIEKASAKALNIPIPEG